MTKHEVQADDAVRKKGRRGSAEGSNSRTHGELSNLPETTGPQSSSEIPNILHARNRKTDDVIDNLHRMLSEQVLISPPARVKSVDHILSGATARRVGRTKDRQTERKGRPRHGRGRRDLITERISEVQELNSLALAAGIEVSEGTELLSRATRALHDKDLASAEKYVSGAERVTRSSAARKVPRLSKEVRASLSQLESVCGPDEPTRLLLSESKESSKRRKYRQALLALTSARRRIRDVQNETVLRIILDGKEKFVMARKLGLDIDRAVVLLNKSRESLRNGRFADSVRFARDGSKLVDNLLDVHEETGRPLTECIKAVKLAQALGAESADLESKLNEAMMLSRGDDLAAADKCCRALLEEADAAAYEKAAECYGLAEKALSLARGTVGEVTGAHEKLDLARELLEKGELARSVSLSSASMLESDSAISSLIRERFSKIEEFAKGVEKDVESLTEVQDAIETSKQRNMEHLKKYVELSQKIVGEAYENAAAYARVAQDVVKQAYERSVQTDPAKAIEMRDSGTVIVPSDLDIPEEGGPDEKRQKLIEMYLSGKVSESQLNRLLMMIDSSVVRNKLV